MNKLNRLTLIAATSLFAAAGAMAATSSSVRSTATCSEQMRMQTVWTAGPRSQQLARVEKQPVTVCDGKVVRQSPQLARRVRE